MTSWLASSGALEEIQTERARRHLLAFTNHTFPAYRAEPAHELIASTLDRVVTGEIDRLMIFIPPQHGKSELSSRRLPAFWFGKHPGWPVILTSYGASLAYSLSRDARQIVESEEYALLFPEVRTDPSSRAVDNWRIAGRKGELVAAGVGGPITGHGAMLGIVDDPFENWEQAQSLTVRERVWNWYTKTFRTRIWEGGRIVLIMTRWHEDDLAGRLLAEQGERWAVLRLPAVAETQEERDEASKLLGLPLGQPDPLGREPGEPLCPGRFSAETLAEIQTDVGSLGWFAEYQGTPRAPEGNTFKRGWFEIVGAVPAELDVIVRYWDKAGTADAGTFTAGVLMARAGRVYYVLDVVRGQWSAGRREATIKQTTELDRIQWGSRVATWLEQEGGSGGKESAENTIANLAGYNVHAETVTGSKEVRAQPFAAQAEAGNVKLLRGAWNAAYLAELSAFPNSTYKDQVDGSSGAFSKVTIGKAPAASAEPRVISRDQVRHLLG